MRDSGELIAEVAGQGSLADIAGELAALARPAFRLVELDGPPARGASKLGGRPDLQEGWDWPVHSPPDGDVQALRFVAQIALSDLDPAVWPGPRDGLLSIFHAFPEGECDEPLAIIHIPAGSDLRPAEYPSGVSPPELVDESAVSVARELTLPDIGVSPALALEELGFDLDEPREDLADDYFNLLEALCDAQDLQPGAARMLGWPWFSQNDVLYEQASLTDEPQSWADCTSLLSIWNTEGVVTTFVLPTADLAAARFDRARAGTQSD